MNPACREANVLGDALPTLNRYGRWTLWLAVFLLSVPAIAQNLATYDSHACTVTAAGTVSCWGKNDHGQLGNGSRVDSNLPVEVVGMTGAVAVQVDTATSCAVLVDGGLRCWGSNDSGQLGDGTRTDRSTPVAARGIVDATAISMRRGYACVLSREGSVRCWGEDRACTSAGMPSCLPGTGPPALPVEVPGLTGAIGIAVGQYYGCAVVPEGRIFCYSLPQSIDSQALLLIEAVDGITDAVAVGATQSGMCALKRNGRVNCWFGGFLSAGGFFSQGWDIPVRNARTLSVGLATSCAISTDNTVQCWRYNGINLGSNDLAASPRPGLDTAVEVVGGLNHVCARFADGRVSCVGDNEVGQLGNGELPYLTAAVPVARLDAAAALYAYGSNSCAIVADGTVRCWGINAGLIAPVAGLQGVISIAMAAYDACATLDSGRVTCWPYGGRINPEYQFNDVRAIGRGNYSSSLLCFLRTTKVTCRSHDGMESPLDVNGTGDAIAIASGYQRGCVIAVDGILKCWTYADFRDANGHWRGPVAAVPVTGLVDVMAVAIGNSARGDESYCAIAGGTVKCWGSNEYGQLGNGSFASAAAVPSDVLGIAAGTAVSIAVGSRHSCATLSSGSVWCWGDNSSGQLGNRSVASSLTAVRVNGIADAVSVSVGAAHGCARLANGSAKCWGDNARNRLGTGIDASIPVQVVGSPFTSGWSPLPPGLTGIWYEPVTSGQGFNIEVLGMDRLLLLFNGYNETGDSLTLTGDYTHSSGALFGKTLTVPVYQTQGRGFSHFDPASILRSWWGEARLTVLDCSRASVQLTGLDGNQRMQMVQLSRPAGLSCAP